MKTSRKGTRLNDAQYFKNPLPHTRQKMTAMFLLQHVSNLQTKYSWDTEDLVTDIRFDAKPKNRGRKINLKDKSIEMASVTREDDSRASNEEKFSEGFRREIFDEKSKNFTEGTSTSILSKMDQTDTTSKNADVVKRDKEKIIENDEIVEELINDEHVRPETKRNSSRWRNSWITQLIFHLFSQIMGKSKKRDTMNEDEEVVAKKSRSYLGYRKEEEDTTTNERSHEEIVSTFVRQIQRTRDKNLRVMLLQRELEARLPAENISRSRMYDEKLATPAPQLSSPLC